MNRLCLIALAVGVFAATTAAAGPAGPADIRSLSLEQRATLLPSDTVVVFHGKNMTLGALRKGHAQLLAHFASLGGLQPNMPPFKRVVLKRAGVVAPVVGVETATPTASPDVGVIANPTTINPMMAGGGVASTLTSPWKHVPNVARPPLPIDYVAACGKISLCIYLPPYPSSDVTGVTFSGVALDGSPAPSWYEYDPLLTANVCQNFGGTYGEGLGCAFTYPLLVQSNFLGRSPDIQSSVNCPYSGKFSIAISDLTLPPEIWAVQNLDWDPSTSLTCAVDLEFQLPSS
jgi:hypothetical protein